MERTIGTMGQPDADRVLDRICDRGGNPEYAAFTNPFGSKRAGTAMLQNE